MPNLELQAMPLRAFVERAEKQGRSLAEIRQALREEIYEAYEVWNCVDVPVPRDFWELSYEKFKRWVRLGKGPAIRRRYLTEVDRRELAPLIQAVRERSGVSQALNQIPDRFLTSLPKKFAPDRSYKMSKGKWVRTTITRPPAPPGIGVDDTHVRSDHDFYDEADFAKYVIDYWLHRLDRAETRSFDPFVKNADAILNSGGTNRARKAKPEDDAEEGNRIAAVIREAKKISGWKTRPYKDLATKLTNERKEKCHGFGFEAVRKILAGRYKQQKKMGLKGLK